jgi:nucleoside 2-deoxyribosyltransferase
MKEYIMLIYFAAPLFCQAEKTFNLQLTEKLEKKGFTVFLPQRDGVDSSKPPYNAMANDELHQAIFAVDQDKGLKAEIFLIVLDGRVPDEGACVALGIAYGQKHLVQQDKLLIVLQTDTRAAFLGAKLNPMIHIALDYIAGNESELISALEEYRQEWMAKGNSNTQESS